MLTDLIEIVLKGRNFMEFIKAINYTGWVNILTGFLAIATVWLAFATWQMAKSTKAMVNLESQPYLAFKELLFRIFVNEDTDKTIPTQVNVGLVFRNPGRVRVIYHVKTIRVTYSNTTIDNPKFLTTGGEVLPNDQVVFWYGCIPFTGTLSLPVKGVVEFEVEYCALDATKPIHMWRKLEYSILSLDPPHCDWVYLEEPKSVESKTQIIFFKKLFGKKN